MFIKSINNDPTIGTMKNAVLEYTYFSVTEFIFAIAFDVIPLQIQLNLPPLRLNHNSCPLMDKIQRYHKGTSLYIELKVKLALEVPSL